MAPRRMGLCPVCRSSAYLDGRRLAEHIVGAGKTLSRCRGAGRKPAKRARGGPATGGSRLLGI